MKQNIPTTRGLIVRLGILVVWAALLGVSIGSGQPLRIAVSSIGLAATVALVALWAVQRRRRTPAAEENGPE
ncbi:MAG: hypothetical protein HY996_11365 [Micrococcales bacterium]|nr:hypothetical protein [Micrococcales bacterium]